MWTCFVVVRSGIIKDKKTRESFALLCWSKTTKAKNELYLIARTHKPTDLPRLETQSWKRFHFKFIITRRTSSHLVFWIQFSFSFHLLWSFASFIFSYIYMFSLLHYLIASDHITFWRCSKRKNWKREKKINDTKNDRIEKWLKTTHNTQMSDWKRAGETQDKKDKNKRAK